MLTAYPYDGSSGDIIASGSDIMLNMNGSGISMNNAYIDFANLALPTAPFAIEARLYWRGA